MKKWMIRIIIALVIGFMMFSSLPISASSMITQEEAERIALATVPGTLIRTELDSDDGVTYFEVYIRTSVGTAEVYINAFSGEIFEIDFEGGVPPEMEGNQSQANDTPVSDAPDATTTPATSDDTPTSSDEPTEPATDGADDMPANDSNAEIGNINRRPDFLPFALGLGLGVVLVGGFVLLRKKKQ